MIKPGDIVESLISIGSSYTQGNHYTVVSIDDDGYITTARDDDGLKGNGMMINRFRLVQPQSDPVNSPSHYTQYSKINGEVLDLIEEVTTHYPKKVAYHIGNALKYLLRAPFKNNMIQDLKKCAFHVNRAVELLGVKDNQDE